MKQKYIIRGIEEVYDCFNEFECARAHEDFEVEAESLEEAVEIGERALQARINKYRTERGDTSKGTFIARVNKVLNMQHQLLYEKKHSKQEVARVIYDESGFSSGAGIAL